MELGRLNSKVWDNLYFVPNHNENNNWAKLWFGPNYNKKKFGPNFGFAQTLHNFELVRSLAQSSYQIKKVGMKFGPN